MASICQPQPVRTRIADGIENLGKIDQPPTPGPAWLRHHSLSVRSVG